MAKVIYISGPITGVENYRERFDKVAEELHSRGYIVLKPSVLPKGLTDAQYMRIDLAMIDCADCVYFLRGYERSAGALLELDYCRYTDKEVLYE